MTSLRLVQLAAPLGAVDPQDGPGGALLCSIDLVELDGKKTPPREFKILGAGVTQTTKGPVRMSAAAGQSVLSKLAELGRDRLNFDYGHAQLGFMQSYEAARSAGWFSVQVRGEGDRAELWATDIEWTPTALRALSDREFRYFSPALMLDSKSGEVRELINIALTNIPATKHQKPLVASQTQTPADPAKDSNDMTIEQLLAAFGCANGTQLAAKFQALQSDNDKLIKAAAEQQTQLSAATTELAALRSAKEQAEKTDYVAQLSTAGKLPPALRDWALGQPMAVLQAYAAAAPALPAASTTTTPPAKTEVPAVLSDDERALCRQLNLSEADYLAEKKALAASPSVWVSDPNTPAPAAK